MGIKPSTIKANGEKSLKLYVSLYCARIIIYSSLLLRYRKIMKTTLKSLMQYFKYKITAWILKQLTNIHNFWIVWKRCHSLKNKWTIKWALKRTRIFQYHRALKIIARMDKSKKNGGKKKAKKCTINLFASFNVILTT